jgi:hypothetical protein
MHHGHRWHHVAREVPSPSVRPWQLSVASGLAWQGYWALEFKLLAHGLALPSGSTGWLALVEQVPAGSAGNADTRELVRAVAGPLPLPTAEAGANPPAGRLARPYVHLHALRWPDSARVDRLQARAWVEGPQGQVLAMAADRCLP